MVCAKLRIKLLRIFKNSSLLDSKSTSSQTNFPSLTTVFSWWRNKNVKKKFRFSTSNYSALNNLLAPKNLSAAKTSLKLSRRRTKSSKRKFKNCKFYLLKKKTSWRKKCWDNRLNSWILSANNASSKLLKHKAKWKADVGALFSDKNIFFSVNSTPRFI